MKKLLLVMAIAMVSASSFAQDTKDKKIYGSVGVELAAPIGDFGDLYNFGIGGTAQGEYMAADNVGITLNAGYISYSGKTIAGLGKIGSVGQIPILAGARYYFIKDIYVSGQLGLSLFKAKGADSETYFNYVPGIGAKVSIIDATLKYMGATEKKNFSPSNVSLRVAVTF